MVSAETGHPRAAMQPAAMPVLPAAALRHGAPPMAIQRWRAAAAARPPRHARLWAGGSAVAPSEGQRAAAAWAGRQPVASTWSAGRQASAHTSALWQCRPPTPPARPAPVPACLPACLQSKRTKKVGIVGKYGTRYGASLRKQIKKIEVSQHSKYFCSFCGKVRAPAGRKRGCGWAGCSRRCRAPGADWLAGCMAQQNPCSAACHATAITALPLPRSMCALQCCRGPDLLVLAALRLTRPHAACLPARPQFGMKRLVVGIWKCKACNKTQAGGAYVLK